MEICALIMAGGRGTRFWPWSSDLLPKQFLPIADPEKSLLRQTFERIVPLTGVDRVLVLTNKEYFPLVRTHLPEIDPKNIVGEPLLRDTAAAVGLGHVLAAARWPNAVQMVLAADHEIKPEEHFRTIMQCAAENAYSDGKLYTIGITPNEPSTSYGYLKRGSSREAKPGFKRFDVDAFVEKPDAETASDYVSSGEYYWNAGIFVWRPDAIRDALARRLPQHAELLPQAVSFWGTDDFDARLRDIFLKLKKISIDFGVMQEEGSAGNVRMIEGDFEWSDLGGWPAFAAKLDADADGNRVFGHAMNRKDDSWQERWQPRNPRENDKDEDLSLGDVFTMNARDNIVFNNRRGHAVTLLGVNGLSVIHTHLHTLILPTEKSEAIKGLVSALPDLSRTGGMITPQKVHKPWGWELWWGWCEDFAGKTLFLKQGKRFSLQYHVVKEEVIYLHEGQVRLETAAHGEALETFIMNPGDAVHVEPGRIHRIEAIEDSLLFESSTPFLWDVVRMQDDFGREGTRQAEAPEGSGKK